MKGRSSATAMVIDSFITVDGTGYLLLAVVEKGV